jgi:hypothetical protein
MRTAIIGSCVTRDVWRVLNLPASDIFFRGRTSLPSLFSPPVPDLAVGSLAALADSFETRMVRHDLLKTSLDELLEFRPEVIFLDFIDERLDLLALHEAIVTYSFELENSGLLASPPLSEARQIPRTSPFAMSLWQAALTEAAKWLARPELANCRIVLHQARWATDYVLDGAAKPFDDARWIFPPIRARISEHNRLLAEYHAQFLRRVTRAEILSVEDDLLVADAAHQWGLSPFHYVDAYYDRFAEKARASGLMPSGPR